MHRAEQIIDAVAELVSAQADIGATVFVNHTLSLSDADQELPAVCVNMGADQAFSDVGYENLAFVDSLLEVKLALHAKADSQQELVTELMRMRTVAHKALLTSPRDLGLEFVMGIRYGGAAEPELSTEGAPFAGRLDCAFAVHYRMNLTDPE